MRRPPQTVGLALVALLAPAGWGLAVAPLAARTGATRGEIAGLLLLALAATLSPGPPDPRRGPAGGFPSPPGAAERPGPVLDAPAAVRLTGRWRAPPTGPPHLDTRAGPVALALASDVAPPAPGTLVEILARVDAAGRATAIDVTVRGPPRGAWLDRWVQSIRGRIETLTAGDRRGVVAALLLGRRDQLHHAVVEACAHTGTLHLLALSGMHVALVALVLQRLVGMAVARHRRVLQGVLLVLFVLLAGARPPLLRALGGWLLAVAGLATGRLAPPLGRLAVVALALLALRPALAHDLSAQLSFLAVGGLLAAMRLAPGPLVLLAAPAGAFLATAPLCAEVFGRVQPWGLLVTPVLVPLVSVILGVGVTATFSGSSLAFLDGLTGPVLDGSAELLVAAWDLGATWLPPPLTPPPLPLPGVLVSLAVVAALNALGHGARDPELWAT